MTDELDIAKRLIALLERLRQSPMLYFGSDDPTHLQILMTGLILGFQLFSHERVLPRRDDVRDKILRMRGWDTSRKLVDQMDENGLDSHNAVGEIIGIEILAIKERMGMD